MASRCDLTSISKFLSLVLDEAGWARIEDLRMRNRRAAPRFLIPLGGRRQRRLGARSRAAAAGRSLSCDTLAEVVRSSDKQRFAISADGLRIRANQGHTVDVALGLAAATPPGTLFHGTASRLPAAILQTGLDKRQRHHVRLSDDRATARAVGQRHGTPVVLEIDAARLCADGHVFHRSANGVWLVDHVPAPYLKVHD